MMQTTRRRRLDRLERRDGTGQRVVFVFNWGDSEEAAPPRSPAPKESAAAAGDDPVLNSGWAAPQGDGKPSL